MEIVKFYWSPEPLQFGDQVQFRIATRTYDHLIYAVDIMVEQTAKEIRFRVRGEGGRGREKGEEGKREGGRGGRGERESERERVR